jgi:hypothetical protein
MSAGNLVFLQALIEQLRVPPAKALEVGEQVLDADLLDPLGGKYQLEGRNGGLKRWVSTKSPTTMPTGYQFPALYWIRGAQAEGRLEEGRLLLDADLDIPVNPPNTK